MARNRSVLGIYRSRTDLERGVQALRDAGFSNNDISVLFSEGSQTREFAHEKGTKAPEGTAAGAASGAVIGGTLGWLAGIGSLAIPGVGPFIAAGPIMAAFAGVGVGGTVGGLTGALVGLGIPEYEAKRYEGRVKEGGILLSVHCSTSDEEDRVEDILERTGAHDISTTGEASADEEAHEGARGAGRRPAAETGASGAGTRMSGVGAGAGTAGTGAWSEYQADCRRDYETKYAHSGAQWNTMEPAYQYGHRMASDPRYRGRSWFEVEADMRASYLRDHPSSDWEGVKDAIRYGWERVSGRH
ncbi:MAG: quinol:electron acceptor oxidoreductase subunit ActD [Candidatus Methylomirabilales bacterium]